MKFATTNGLTALAGFVLAVATAAGASDDDQQVRAFLAKHCRQCRTGEEPEAIQSQGKPVTFCVSSGPLRGKEGLIGYFDAPAEKPTVIEFTRHFEPRTSSAILPYELSKEVHQVGADKWDGPGLAVHHVEVEGPLHDAWPPESHRRLFGDLPRVKTPDDDFGPRLEVTSDHPSADAERILERFARRAFRRSVTERDVEPFLAVVKARLDQNESFEEAVRVGLLGILVAPDFLFLREKPGHLDDFALASRLSYFLWSTMPDDGLLALAEQGKLRQADTLSGQVERMLADPRSSALTENFAGQWLKLRDIDSTEPSYLTYPEFDHMLKVSMIRETELFFEEVLKNDLSLTNFVTSDFTMLNGRLARHYGIPGPDGWEFKKTSLPPDSHRGGVLTMASVLKVMADGTNTSPVKRGAWVLDRILGTPPPRPPAGVVALEPDIRGAKTLREQLEKHRDAAQCASCHAKIDPPGFALESFDVIGGWREYYRVSHWASGVQEVPGKHYYRGADVDAAGQTADGERFEDIDGYKRWLLKDKDQLALALAEKLVTYGTGAAPHAADKPEIEAIVRKVKDENYGLRSLVHEVVQSKLFQDK